MADRFPSLDEFDSGQTDVRNVPASADASSFLDRERALLGEDADQFATPHDLKATTVEDADDDLLGGDSGTYDVPADEMMGFETEFPDIDSQNHNVGPSGSITGISSFPTTTSYTAPVEDSAPMAAWRSKREADIATRDKISEDKKAATIAEARQAIDDFYDSYNDKKDKNIAQTRREAEEFLESRDDTTAGGTSWERISKLVDLSGKGVKGGSASSGKERFREMLLSLRKDENAPGAKGV